ncbi:hypothetical protein SDC9_177716 [bioreactor metagenome]|uniref:Uncharacterized protein n=1 Tax=bioreactor metagenome TaxID=1076179 RepID=A0A645H345_9ZZZZ
MGSLEKKLHRCIFSVHSSSSGTGLRTVLFFRFDQYADEKICSDYRDCKALVYPALQHFLQQHTLGGPYARIL